MERRMAKIEGPKGQDFLEISESPMEREITTDSGSKRVKSCDGISVKETSISHKKVEKTTSYMTKTIALRLHIANNY